MKLKRVLGTAIAAMMVIPMFAANSLAYEGGDIPVTAEYFPDEAFRNYIINNFNSDSSNDVNGTVYLSADEINAVDFISCDDAADFTGINYFTEIVSFVYYGSDAKNIDLSSNTKLDYIDISDSEVESLILGNNEALTELVVYRSSINTLDITGCPNITDLEVDRTNISTIDISNCGALANIYLNGSLQYYGSYEGYRYSESTFYGIDFSVDKTEIKCDAIMINEANFEDDGLRECIANNLDTKADGVLTRAEMNAATEINCSFSSVSSLKGIENFPNLQKLVANSNSISSVDLSKNTMLNYIDLSFNSLSNLDVSKQPELKHLDVNGNDQISSLNLTNNTKLTSLNLGLTSFSGVDLSIFPDLEEIFVYNTKITSLDVSKNPKLKLLIADTTSISSINLKNNPDLETLSMSYTNLSSIDITANKKLNNLNLYSSNIYAVNISDAPELINIKNNGELYTTDSIISYSLDMNGSYHYLQLNANTKITVDRPAETTVEGFAERLYTCALNRPSEPEGKQTWVDVLYDGSWNGAQVAEGFFFSDELVNKKPVTDEEFVRRLYATFMGRTPDQGGMNTWMGVLANGGTRQDVFKGFIESQEWANVCFRAGIVSGGQCAPNITLKPTEDITAFATRLYTTCLNRQGEAKGIADWANFIANRIFTGTEAAYGFFFSDEFKAQNVSNSVYVDRLYRTFMNREGDKSGRDMWIGLLDRGEWNREQVFYGFADSAEFIKICREAGIRH